MPPTGCGPVLEGRVPEEIVAPQARHSMDRWPQRLAGRAVRSVDAHGKHLFLRFEGDLTLHSHLRMTGVWGVYERNRRWGRSRRRAWLVLRTPSHEVVEFDGPVLELLTESRTRFDRRLASLGPDVLADEFDAPRFLRRSARGRPDARLRRRPARPAHDRGHRKPVEGRDVLGGGIDPWRPRDRSPTKRRSPWCRGAAAHARVRQDGPPRARPQRL
jgi:endonuclease-8